MLIIKKSGYSLIEYCVYLSCCCITAVIISWFVLDFIRISQHQLYCKELAHVGALHLFGNDILYAPQDRHEWLIKKSDVLIWKNHKEHVGWILHNNNLWRITGTYNKERGTWSKAKKNLIAYSVYSFTTTIIMKRNRVIGVKVILKAKNTTLTFHFPTLHGKRCFIS